MKKLKATRKILENVGFKKHNKNLISYLMYSNNIETILLTLIIYYVHKTKMK